MYLQMSYDIYKHDPIYQRCGTRPGSYDPETKTILVDVPDEWYFARAICDIFPAEVVAQQSEGSEQERRWGLALDFAKLWVWHYLDDVSPDELPDYAKAAIRRMENLSAQK